MNIISHRGNLKGPDCSIENKPEQIDLCISMGFEVEIDLRLKDKKPFLGHDSPQYEVTSEWIENRKDNLLIHVKDFDGLVWLRENNPKSRYFCHHNDDYTLISNGDVWIHNLEIGLNNDCVIPLIDENSLKEFNFSKNEVKGICTDHVFVLKELLKSLKISKFTNKKQNNSIC